MHRRDSPELSVWFHRALGGAALTIGRFDTKKAPDAQKLPACFIANLKHLALSSDEEIDR